MRKCIIYDTISHNQYVHLDFCRCLKSLQTSSDVPQNKFLFCGITNTKQKQVPSKVYSVRCVGCVECEGEAVCTVTGVAKLQLTGSGHC